MKANKLFIALFTSASLIISCNESVDLLTDGAQTGGFVDVTNKALGYVVGNPGPYTVEFLARQTTSSIESIELHKSFTSTQKYIDVDDNNKEKDTTFVSNEVLDRTINITEEHDHFITTTYDYSELIADLTINNLGGTNEPLPVSDLDLTIGDSWNFRVVVNMKDGRTLEQGYTFSFSVSTRYAGIYKVDYAEYYRIGVPRPDVAWPETFTIKSIDAKTYQILEYFGPFAANTLYFQIDNGAISYPAEWPAGTAQLGNGQPLITCESNPADMADVYCDDSNLVIDDYDGAGADLLVMSYGYLTSGTTADGPRTMYCELIKVVE